jgi:hypothetical protein
MNGYSVYPGIYNQQLLLNLEVNYTIFSIVNLAAVH